MLLGRKIRDFARCENNPRNSEGAFIEMEDKTIAFVYSRFRGNSKEDGATCDLAISYSHDGGETFSDGKVILTPESCGASNLMSVSLIRLKDGNIGLFYLKKTADFNCVYYMRKTKDFISFSDEIRCIAEDSYFVVNNDRVRRLNNGDLIFPSSRLDFKLVKNEKTGEMKAVHGEGVAVVYLSKDDGLTWQKTTEIEMPFENFKKGRDAGLLEPGIIELANGSIYIHFRCAVGRQLESYSYDGGYTFTKPVPSRFTSPTSPMSTYKLKNGKIVVVYNPIPLYPGRVEGGENYKTGGRTPYVLEVADENLGFINPVREIENDEKAGFCYTAMLETDEALLLAYCAGGVGDVGVLTRLRIKKIDKAELFQ